MPGTRAANAAAERVGVLRIGQADVDRPHRFGGRRIVRPAVDRHQIRQVQARFDAAAGEAHRIGRRLVDAGDAKLRRASVPSASAAKVTVSPTRSDACSASCRERRMSGSVDAEGAVGSRIQRRRRGERPRRPLTPDAGRSEAFDRLLVKLRQQRMESHETRTRSSVLAAGAAALVGAQSGEARLRDARPHPRRRAQPLAGDGPHLVAERRLRPAPHRIAGHPAGERVGDEEVHASGGSPTSHQERWKFGKGWSLVRFTAHLVEPQIQPLIGFPQRMVVGHEGTGDGRRRPRADRQRGRLREVSRQARGQDRARRSRRGRCGCSRGRSSCG